MTVVNVTLPSDGTTANVADYNDPINTIVAVLNGNLDDTNIASLSGTKLTAGTVPGSAMNAAFRLGWNSGVLATPNTVIYNGNRSYDLIFNSVDYTSLFTARTRFRITRSNTAPTRCTSLNGTNQYWVKTSPNKMTWSDDFAISAWIKLSNYPSVPGAIASRYNGTSGWYVYIGADGTVQLAGHNAGGGNFSFVKSAQSVPLNKWIHVTAQLDMSAFTATTTTSYIMLDGLDVPATVSRGGTNPITLIQAGNLEIGSLNGGINLFPGKIAQVAIYNAKVTQANVRATISQGLSGTETSLASAYSFDNSVTDLNTTTPNDLSVGGGSAVATNADSPFSVNANGTPDGSKDFGIVTKVAFSTNTTVTVQVPEGNTIPTSGGVSAVDYSTVASPFGMPMERGKWRIETLNRAGQSSAPGAGTYQNLGSMNLTIPTGQWMVEFSAHLYLKANAANTGLGFAGLHTALGALPSDGRFIEQKYGESGSTPMGILDTWTIKPTPLSVASPTIYYLNEYNTAVVLNYDLRTSTGTPPEPTHQIVAELAYL